MGRVVEGLSVQSQKLGKAVNYSIYLPPGYDQSLQSYPVVYLLHGYTDDQTAWVQFGQINLAVDAAIAARELPPMIIVMPDGGVSFYTNSYDGKQPYEDMFVSEFMPAVERQYRIRAKKEFRGITGLSMGGYGTLLYALRHPDLFAACAPLSAAVWDDEDALKADQATWDRVFAQPWGTGLAGEARLTEHWKATNPFHLAKTKGADSLKKVRYYFDCGDDDFLLAGNAKFMILMREMQVPSEFRFRDGAHTWEYWRTGIVDALKFIGESFHR